MGCTWEKEHFQFRMHYGDKLETLLEKLVAASGAGALRGRWVLEECVVINLISRDGSALRLVLPRDRAAIAPDWWLSVASVTPYATAFAVCAQAQAITHLLSEYWYERTSRRGLRDSGAMVVCVRVARTSPWRIRGWSVPDPASSRCQPPAACKCS
ncbi:hypothetical protein ANO11243_063070 [Dothideomycetidae sp. 11243]|nr:hypothetical protein ANO11243_063070 [fungal sp. No.11243]